MIESSEDTLSLDALAEIELQMTLAEDIASETFVAAVDVNKIFGVLPAETPEEE